MNERGTRAQTWPTRASRVLGSRRLAVICFCVLAGVTLAVTFLEVEDAFRSIWFLTPMALLFIGSVVASVRRLRHLRPGGRGALPLACLHVSVPLIVCGGIITGLGAEEHLVTLNVGEETSVSGSGPGDKKRPLGFRLRLESLEPELYASEAAELVVRLPEHGIVRVLPLDGRDEFVLDESGHRFRVLRETEDFAVEPAVPEEVRKDLGIGGPALLVDVGFPDGRRQQRWLFAEAPMRNVNARADVFLVTTYRRRPDVKNYRVGLQLGSEESGGTERRIVRVNKPARYEGRAIYLFRCDEPGYRFATLSVRRDPGVPIVYAGFLLLFLSLLAVHADRSRTERR